MLIHCPHCGPRDVGEFTYGGDATKDRPDPETAAAADWCDYVFYRDNPRGRHGACAAQGEGGVPVFYRDTPRGRHVEYWHHGQGCRLWLKVARDTVTHKIESAELVGPWAAQAPRKERGAA